MRAAPNAPVRPGAGLAGRGCGARLMLPMLTTGADQGAVLSSRTPLACGVEGSSTLRAPGSGPVGCGFDIKPPPGGARLGGTARPGLSVYGLLACGLDALVASLGNRSRSIFESP